MSKKTTADSLDISKIPFTDIFVKVVELQSKKVLIIAPEQGLKPVYVNYGDINSLELNKWFKAEVFPGEDPDTFTTKSLTPTKLPTPDDIKASKVRTEATFAKIKEMEAEIEKMKANAFKANNAIPPVPKDLYIHDKVWDLTAASLNLDKYVILLGPKGCGKTETAKQLGVACKMNFVAFNMGAAFKPKQMFAGMLQAKDGDTVFVESEFLKAFQATEPTLIFLDEITRTPQVATNYLMTILDRNQSYIYIEELGKRVYKGAGVRFVSAGNVGTQYTDTRTLDGAFWDRFVKLPIDYLPKHEEEKLVLQRAPKANRKHIQILIDRANKCRDAEKSGSITSGISTRQLIDMAHYLEIGFSLEDVYENVFLNNFINGNNNEVDLVKTICQS